MSFDNLGTVERKVLGAMLLIAGDDNKVKASLEDLAHKMGYKSAGGAITFALRILERDNYIVKESAGRYKLLI